MSINEPTDLLTSAGIQQEIARSRAGIPDPLADDQAQDKNNRGENTMDGKPAPGSDATRTGPGVGTILPRDFGAEKPGPAASWGAQTPSRQQKFDVSPNNPQGTSAEKNLLPETESVGAQPMRDGMDGVTTEISAGKEPGPANPDPAAPAAQADALKVNPTWAPPRKIEVRSMNELATNTLPGQGYDPTGATSEESPVVAPQDVKILDGEGNLTNASSEVDSLEQGDGANGGDGGDAGGQSVGMDGERLKAEGLRLSEAVKKNYQAAGPDSPYTDQQGNPSQDPLAVAVDGMQSSKFKVQSSKLPGCSGSSLTKSCTTNPAPTLAQEALASITPPDPDSALRQPTATSGEIGGRETGDDGSVLSLRQKNAVAAMDLQRTTAPMNERQNIAMTSMALNKMPGKKEGGHESPPAGYPKDKGSYADPENYRYPLDTEAHVRAAWSYIHQGRNEHGFSPSELASVKGRIRTAARKYKITLDE